MHEFNVHLSAYSACKRCIDVVVSVVMVVMLAPFGAIIALLIRLDSEGPVVFSQTVVGLNGLEFRLLKFRTMRPGSQDLSHRQCLRRNVSDGQPTGFDSAGKPIFKTATLDPSRITSIGKVLRKTSFDELPQLWNVLVGEMSLVGPRPSLPWEVELYDSVERDRLSVKPGLTGLYQVTARNRVPVREMVRIDLEYVRRRSIWLDLKLLLQTPLVMFNGI